MRNVEVLSYVTSPLSEYIGSNIYKILGYEVQETSLGICFDGRRNKVVCACKDFIKDESNERLIPYTALRNDTNPLIMERRESSIDSASDIGEIIFQLRNNTILKEIPDAWDRFWNVILVDMLINNNDRNEDNWGVIKFQKENKCVLAPVYDCGNCFYDKATEERIESFLRNPDKLHDSSLNGVTAFDDENGKRITAVRVLDFVKMYSPEMFRKVYTNVCSHLNEIEELVQGIPCSFNDIEVISDNRKRYYRETFKIRLNLLGTYC